MFGRKPASIKASTAPTSHEVVHQFDQTNGVMKDFDLYQSRMRGETTLLDYDSDEQKDKLFRAGAIGGMLGGST